ncbi:hypothetical protein [Streptomyces sp. NPDC020607]|uniref:hypothetical protein n=1 Tax=Streptomyces sp. NPDC020607 TaxID=3365082 RepID=UPI0037ADDAAF
MLRRLLAWLLPGTGTRRAPRETRGYQPHPTPGARDLRPRSPYARDAAENRPIDVSGAPLARPYLRARPRTEPCGILSR